LSVIQDVDEGRQEENGNITNEVIWNVTRVNLKLMDRINECHFK
jgi:hypothetical protein